MRRTTEPDRIIFDEPASCWHEALPVGNGRLGAMVFGGTAHETLAINEDTLWCGEPETEKNRTKPNLLLGNSASEQLEKISELASERKYVAAHDAAFAALEGSRDLTPYSYFGSLTIDMKNSGADDISDVAQGLKDNAGDSGRGNTSDGYTRFLDMSKGICETDFCIGDNRVLRRSYASAPADCIITYIKAEKPVDITLGYEGGCITDIHSENGMLIAEGHCYANDPAEGGNVIRYAGVAGVYTYYGGKCAADMSGAEGRGTGESGAECRDTDARNTEAHGTDEHDCRTGFGPETAGCRCVTEAVVIFTAKTNYRAVLEALKDGTDYEAAATKGPEGLVENCAAQVGAVSRRTGFFSSENAAKASCADETLLAEHLTDYTELYSRVQLKLPEAYDIYSTLFNYGRYLMISASRPGSQPANLQGIWNNMLTPPWNCNYTVNINTEMNYWLTGPCNLHETAEPLLAMMEELCETGRSTAHDYYDAEGTCSFHNVNIWRKSSPAWGNPMWNFWPLGSQWLCRNLFEECLFTGDPKYILRTEKVMRENLRFCLSIARQTVDGLAITPGTSPENEFWWRDDAPEIAISGHHVSHPKTWDDWMALSEDGCRKVAVGAYSENENAIFRNLCRDYIELCDMIDDMKGNGSCQAADCGAVTEYVYDRELRDQARDALIRIVPIKTDSRGRIMEWNEEMPEGDEHHRHLSHLYELHPGRGITESDTALYEAVRQSLLVRGDEGTGWSLAWKLLMWARMKDGAHEEGLLQMFTRHVDAEPMWGHGGGIYSNLFCAHPPFQIDGNYGFTAGVAEMLVQSHEDYIHILPALPPSWDHGSVTGLKARGNVTVDIIWEDDKVDVKFHGEAGKHIRYRVLNREISETVI